MLLGNHCSDRDMAVAGASRGQSEPRSDWVCLLLHRIQRFYGVWDFGNGSFFSVECVSVSVACACGGVRGGCFKPCVHIVGQIIGVVDFIIGFIII